MVKKIATSSVIPHEMKPILFERAILPKRYINRLDSMKFEYIKQFCSCVSFPKDLLEDKSQLENLIDSLLLSNSSLPEHFNDLLKVFLFPFEGDSSLGR